MKNGKVLIGDLGVCSGEIVLGDPAMPKGVPGATVSVSSGLGNGLYPVYAVYEDGAVARVIVEFMEMVE